MKKIIEKIKQLGVKGILLMHFGLFCVALSSTIFLNPSHMVASGSTGLSIMLASIVDIPYYVFLYAINGFLLILSFIFLGKDFSLKTVYGSLIIPTFAMLIEELCKLFNLDFNMIINSCNSVFVVVFSSFLTGIGIGINLKYGGSTGGFDILEAIMNKFFHISFSTSVLILDALLIVLGMFYFKLVEGGLFTSKLDEGMASLCYVIAIGFFIDMITFGSYNKRAVYISSSKYEEVHDAIVKYLARGVTYMDVEGGFSHLPTKMLLCVCYSREYNVLRDLVSKIDPNAFLFVTKATEVRGLGFSIETKEHLERRKNKKKI